MKKICFITDSLKSGGAERVLSILANEFIKEKYDITIFSKAHIPPFYELDESIQLVFPKVKVNYRNKISTSLSRIHLYREMYKTLKGLKPDLVITFSTTTNGTVIPISRILGIPVIASEHTNYKVSLSSFPIRFIKRYIYPYANMVTVLTQRDKNEYYSKFMKNIVVMPNPLSMPPIEYFSPDREKTILAVGGINRWKIKGFDNLIEIFSQISKQHPDWKLKIAGAGDSDYIQKLIIDYDLSEKVQLLGEIKDIQTHMAQASIFTLTSRWEGLPMVLLEAMSQGMACIAYDCFTGPRDIITNGIDGILVDNQNISDFVSKLSDLIGTEERRIQLGRAAIESSKNYLPEKIILQWKQLISTIK